jgi:hypothetical protein
MIAGRSEDSGTELGEEAAKATRRHKLEAKRKGETIRTNEKKTKKRRKKKTRKRRFQKRRTKTEKNLTM